MWSGYWLPMCKRKITPMHPFEGVVIRGAERGRAIGFPTANLELIDAAQRPPDGIYAGWVEVLPETQRWMAAIHAGPVPTYEQATPTVEVHLLDWPQEQELYGKRLRVKPMQRLRDIKKFATELDLAAAISADVQKTRVVLADNG